MPRQHCQTQGATTALPRHARRLPPPAAKRKGSAAPAPEWDWEAAEEEEELGPAFKATLQMLDWSRLCSQAGPCLLAAACFLGALLQALQLPWCLNLAPPTPGVAQSRSNRATSSPPTHAAPAACCSTPPLSGPCACQCSWPRTPDPARATRPRPWLPTQPVPQPCPPPSRWPPLPRPPSGSGPALSWRRPPRRRSASARWRRQQRLTPWRQS